MREKERELSERCARITASTSPTKVFHAFYLKYRSIEDYAFSHLEVYTYTVATYFKWHDTCTRWQIFQTFVGHSNRHST